jgi:hypothetical protein
MRVERVGRATITAHDGSTSVQTPNDGRKRPPLIKPPMVGGGRLATHCATESSIATGAFDITRDPDINPGL